MQTNPSLDKSDSSETKSGQALRGEATRNRSMPLVERLDPALGEASSGIGAVLTELIRKTLRGGVQRIDEELQEQVEEKVELSVASHMPKIEDAARQKAETTARVVADERVEKLEGEFHETSGRLSENIEASEERAKHLIEQQIGVFREKTKSASAKIKEELTSLKEADSSLEKHLRQQASEFEQQTLQLTDTINRLQERIAELEKPRGLRKLFGFMGKKKKPPGEQAS